MLIDTPNYLQKKKEIELYINELKSYSQDRNMDFFKILKSNVYLMLYNMMESTVKEIIANVYDQINTSNLTYKKLNDILQSLWEKHQFYSLDKGGSDKIQSYKNKAHKMITQVVHDQIVKFNEHDVHLSGNVDLNSMFELMREHGIDISMNDIGKFSDELLAVKNQRNNLSHGSTSFVETGRDVTLEELQTFIIDTEECLDVIIRNVGEYLDKKLYLKKF